MNTSQLSAIVMGRDFLSLGGWGIHYQGRGLVVQGLFVGFVAGFPNAKQLNLLVILTFFRPQKVNCYLPGCETKAPPLITNALPP